MSLPRPRDSALVYSTDTGRLCPGCGQAPAACRCKADAARAARPRGDGIVRVSREKAGRGGKLVTLVRGLDLPDDALAALGKTIRAGCGAGGTVRDGVLEVQGDHVERVMALLAAPGRVIKRAGG